MGGKIFSKEIAVPGRLLGSLELVGRYRLDPGDKMVLTEAYRKSRLK